MPALTSLPPLILHPFSGGSDRLEDLLEGSRASLALEGLIDSSEERAALELRMLQGRYQELQMLVFLGKDVFRWLTQCVESMRESGAGSPINEQSLATFLVEDPPEAVASKLQRWGVSDRRGVFSRAVGIYSLFCAPPPMKTLAPTFLKNYHRYADHSWICFQHLAPLRHLSARTFDFEIYASEEYARKLAEEWQRA